jgi:hypothetical protein
MPGFQLKADGIPGFQVQLISEQGLSHIRKSLEEFVHKLRWYA